MSKTYFCSPAPNPSAAIMKLIHFEKIVFDHSVEIKSKQLENIPWCQKDFYTDKELSLCTVNINIPYVGHILDNWKSSKIVLFLDEEPIYTGQINSHCKYPLHPLFISADKPCLKPGQHKISLKACVTEGGHLGIPFLDKYNIEFTDETKNFATIKILGFY